MVNKLSKNDKLLCRQMFSLFFCIFFWKTRHSSHVEYYASPPTGYKVSVSNFGSTKIQTVRLFVIVDFPKHPIKFSRKNDWVTNIFIIFICEIRSKNLLIKSSVNLNVSGNAEIFVLPYQNLSKDKPKFVSRYGYAGNEERRKHNSNTFPTRH